MKQQLAAGLVAAVIVWSPAQAADFTLAFAWGDIPLCTTGQPNRVANPEFRLSDVPEGTAKIGFKLVDLDVPQYNHGGGAAPYDGGTAIASGAFRYKSPCPPNGQHTYRWTATAFDANGNELGQANAERIYPE